MPRTSFWRALRATRREHWKDALFLALFSQIGGLAPVWIGMIWVAGYGGQPDLIRFARGGEFAIYSAAVLAPAIFLIVSERPARPFSAQPVYMLVALVSLLLSVAGYTLVAPAAIGVVPGAGLRVNDIAKATLALFLLSVVLAVVITALDNARMRPAVAELAKEQQRDLEGAFDKLQN